MSLVVGCSLSIESNKFYIHDGSLLFTRFYRNLFYKARVYEHYMVVIY